MRNYMSNPLKPCCLITNLIFCERNPRFVCRCLKTIDESDVIVNRNLTLLFEFTIYGTPLTWKINFVTLVIKSILVFFWEKNIRRRPIEMSRR